jgi:serine/threonine protein kinase
VHGDLRGTNILIDDNEDIRLADFGLTVFADATNGHTSCVGGSTRWMAPELFVPKLFGLDCYRRTYASDIYAVACVAVEVRIRGCVTFPPNTCPKQACTKAPPFPNFPAGRFGEIAVLLHVIKGGRPERPLVDVMTDPLWRLVEMCWSHDIATRPRACEVADYMKYLIVECSTA